MRPLRFAVLAIEFTIIHLLVAGTCVVFGDGTSLLSRLAGLVGKALILPVIALWALLPRDGVPDAVQLAILGGNSALWGLAVALFFRWATPKRETHEA